MENKNDDVGEMPNERLEGMRAYEGTQRDEAQHIQQLRKRAADLEKAKKRRLESFQMLAMILTGTASGILTIERYGPENISREQVLSFASTISLIISIVFLLYLIYGKFGDSIRFIDIDRFRVKRVLDPSAAWPFPVGGGYRDEVSEEREYEEYLSREMQRANDLQEQSPFRRYFEDVKNLLEEKAGDADSKASLLLDKGTAYTRWGIYFFLFSIIAWQLMTWEFGFKPAYIYGMISCSALFIFIEFLSAWFLRQYRHYVDTSTYLLKVKAIFDRYMLVYLANESFAESLNERGQQRADKLIELLSADIKWPETHLFKKPDVSFAKEAMDAMTNLTKEIRREKKLPE